MKIRTGTLLLVVFSGFVVGSFLLSRNGTQPAASLVPWETSLSQAKAKAAAENKLVLVDFYTDWCKWCKKLDAETFASPAVAEAIAASFVPVRLNAEKEGEGDASRLGVNAYPTVVFLDAKGNEVGRIPGYLGPEEFLSELRAAASKKS